MSRLLMRYILPMGVLVGGGSYVWYAFTGETAGHTSMLFKVSELVIWTGVLGAAVYGAVRYR
jgi:hypothetical protein